jgi:hypothetical protein
MNFNFHDLVAAQVYTNSHQVSAFYESEYSHHQVQEVDPKIPKVSLHFEYKPGWITCPTGYSRQTHKAIAHWVYRIEFSNNQINIDAYGNYFAIPMVHHMLLHPGLRYLTSRQGTLMLHAGAVVYRGSSLIFTGHGGAGKTTTTSLTLTSGGKDWAVHADDYVFLLAGPKSQAYITRSHLYRDLLSLLPEIGAQLSRSERLRLEIFGQLRSWSNDRITWPVRLPIDRLWPGHNIAMTAVPAALLLLEKTDSNNLELNHVDPGDVPVNSLIDMNFREARHFLNLVRKNQSVTNFTSWLASWQTAEYSLLEKRTKDIPVYVLKRPKDVETLNTFQGSLMEKIVDLIP